MSPNSAQLLTVSDRAKVTTAPFSMVSDLPGVKNRRALEVTRTPSRSLKLQKEVSELKTLVLHELAETKRQLQKSGEELSRLQQDVAAKSAGRRRRKCVALDTVFVVAAVISATLCNLTYLQ